MEIKESYVPEQQKVDKLKILRNLMHSCNRDFKLAIQKRTHDLEKEQLSWEGDSEKSLCVSGPKINFKLAIQLLRQVRWFVIQNRVEMKSQSEDKSTIYIAFLWHIIQPHLINELTLHQFDKKLEKEIKKQNDSSEGKPDSKGSQEPDEVDFERDHRLIREFLKTALTLDCFNQAYHHLDDKKTEYKSIQSAILSYIQDTEEELPDYEPTLKLQKASDG